MTSKVEKTASDYSKYAEIDLTSKLQPISRCVENMLARLEEFQTVLRFNKNERENASESFTSILENQEELINLFARIDSVEFLVEHIKANLVNLENKIEKAEQDLGYTENASIANILTPLFKNINERSESQGSSEYFKTTDYFTEIEEN